jgi:ferritin-like metal-binding protein YciE
MKTKHGEVVELRQIFFEQLNDLLSAEKQLVKALPKLAQAANSEELRAAMEAHLDQTEEHVNRLEQVFQLLGDEEISSNKCEAMTALIDEAAKVIEPAPSKGTSKMKRSPTSSSGRGAAIDAALIGAAQKVEHYEIATYGTVCAWAKVLQEDEAADLLAETLAEEKATDEELTELAERLINPEAAEAELRSDLPAEKTGKQELAGEESDL